MSKLIIYQVGFFLEPVYCIHEIKEESGGYVQRKSGKPRKSFGKTLIQRKQLL